MQKPLVSVIIPNYNYGHYLREAIDSVLAQSYPEIEAVVVDDGSIDNSREIIETYGDGIKTIFQQNQGVSAARNNGFEQSSGEFIAFLDADDIWFPAKIEKQIELFAADEGVGLVHTGVVDVDSHGDRLHERTDGMNGWVAEKLLEFERAVILGGGSGMMVTKKAFEQVGGFDLRLSTSADWDFSYQVCSRFKVGFVPDILLKYRVHGSNMHGNIKAMEHDMLLGYEKAFTAGAEADRARCYGNLHKTLAGSYFNAGQYGEFWRHMLKSLQNRPANIGHFLSRSFRKLQYRNAR